MTYPVQQTYQVPDPGPAPTTVRAAFWLVVAQVAFSIVVGLPITFLTKDALLASQPTTPGVDQDAILQAGLTIGVFFVFVADAVWLLFAVKLKQGRNWARITIIVLTIVSIVYTPLNLANAVSHAPLLLVSALPGIATSVVILVLLARDPAKSWTPAKTAFLKSQRW